MSLVWPWLALAGSGLALAGSGLALADSGLALAGSGLALAGSGLALALALVQGWPWLWPLALVGPWLGAEAFVYG